MHCQVRHFTLAGSKNIFRPLHNSTDMKRIMNLLSHVTQVTLFILTALLHPSEATNLVHGIWYFLALPSGSLLLQIYSVANLTDKSWGKCLWVVK